MTRVFTPKSLRAFPQGRRKSKRVKIVDENGYNKWISLPEPLKHKPKKCSNPRRICIACQKTVIRKNDTNYDSKICKACTAKIPNSI